CMAMDIGISGALRTIASRWPASAEANALKTGLTAAKDTIAATVKATKIASLGDFPYPRRNLLQRGEELIAKAIMVLGKSPTLRKLGYRFLDLVQPVKNSAILPNLGKVDSDLYRGGQLGPKGFATLKSQNFDTIINLEAESDTDRQYAAAVGIKVVEIPEAPVGEMPMAQGVQFLQAATDPANGKIYFHCYHGSDRTGAMAAIYQILVQHLPIDQAIAQMSQYGFHSGLEDAKIQFIYDFVKYWNTLPSAQQARILHQAPAPITKAG
ncbi:MAG: dual specificity protein phosphatase family protein, partial [Cyanobacteria bacterium REEB65]|nr:dual specificity protein phosphatase family protein [Cyanobacteria bacterium REEB65]